MRVRRVVILSLICQAAALLGLGLGVTCWLGLLDLAEPGRNKAVAETYHGEPMAHWLHRAAAKDAAAIKPLITALQGSSRDDRILACSCLGAFGLDGEPAVPALMSLLDDSDAKVRKSAASALASIGPAADLALPALRQLCHHGDEAVRKDAQSAIEAITVSMIDKEFASSIGPGHQRELLRSSDPWERWLGLKVVRWQGRVELCRAIPDVVSLLWDRRPFLRRLATLTLMRSTIELILRIPHPFG